MRALILPGLVLLFAALFVRSYTVPPAPDRRGGTTVTAGLPAPTATLPLPPVTLVAEERTLKGSYIGTAVPGRDIPRYIELYRRGRLPVDRLLSGTLKHDELNEGFDRLHAGEVVRQVLVL